MLAYNAHKDQRSKIGNFMYNITDGAAHFLSEHMWLYYILNYTWGIIMTLVGWLVIGFCNVFLRKKMSHCGRFGPCVYVMIGDNWGGLELGTNFLLADYMGEEWTLHTKCHEMGHTFQNAIWGPLSIFLIFIPSFIRYWHQEFRSRKGLSNKDYDLAWFEESATDIGTRYHIEETLNKEVIKRK